MKETHLNEPRDSTFFFIQCWLILRRFKETESEKSFAL